MSLRILLAVDGSIHSVRAAEHVIQLVRANCEIELALLNVQSPIESGHVRQFVARDALEAYYRDGGLEALKEPAAVLEAAAQPYTTHIAVGHIAETIARYASELRYDLIVLGTHGRTGLRQVVMGSVTIEVIKRASVPVTVVKNL